MNLCRKRLWESSSFWSSYSCCSSVTPYCSLPATFGLLDSTWHEISASCWHASQSNAGLLQATKSNLEEQTAASIAILVCGSRISTRVLWMCSALVLKSKHKFWFCSFPFIMTLVFMDALFIFNLVYFCTGLANVVVFHFHNALVSKASSQSPGLICRLC